MKRKPFSPLDARSLLLGLAGGAGVALAAVSYFKSRPEHNLQQVLVNQVEARQAKYPPCGDIIKTRPAYFNAGCCRYNDGDITGIELENGVLRLVKWGQEGGGYLRTILEQNPLDELFLYL